MHINMKYYIVSIGAIFISLGIGILVGYNLNYDQELSKQQASVISDLDNKTIKDANNIKIGSDILIKSYNSSIKAHVLEVNNDIKLWKNIR